MADSYGANDDDSEYVEFRKKLPASLDNSLELGIIIEEIVEMYDDVKTALKEFSTPRALFTYPHVFNSTKLAGVEINPTKTPRENGVPPPLLTHSSLPKSPIVDALESPDSPPPRTHTDARTSSHLASERDLEEI